MRRYFAPPTSQGQALSMTLNFRAFKMVLIPNSEYDEDRRRSIFPPKEAFDEKE
jgi:hypothetical protein